MRTTYTMICEAAKAHGFSINGYGPGLYNVYQQTAPGGWRTLFSGSARECYVWLQGYSQRKREEEAAAAKDFSKAENFGSNIAEWLSRLREKAATERCAIDTGRANGTAYGYSVAVEVSRAKGAEWALDGVPIRYESLLLRLHGFRSIANGQTPIVEQRA